MQESRKIEEEVVSTMKQLEEEKLNLNLNKGTIILNTILSKQISPVIKTSLGFESSSRWLNGENLKSLVEQVKESSSKGINQAKDKHKHVHFSNTNNNKEQISGIRNWYEFEGATTLKGSASSNGVGDKDQ